jgi:hypothetical protein
VAAHLIADPTAYRAACQRYESRLMCFVLFARVRARTDEGAMRPEALALLARRDRRCRWRSSIDRSGSACTPTARLTPVSVKRSRETADDLARQFGLEVLVERGQRVDKGDSRDASPNAHEYVVGDDVHVDPLGADRNGDPRRVTLVAEGIDDDPAGRRFAEL